MTVHAQCDWQPQDDGTFACMCGARVYENGEWIRLPGGEAVWDVQDVVGPGDQHAVSEGGARLTTQPEGDETHVASLADDALTRIAQSLDIPPDLITGDAGLGLNHWATKQSDIRGAHIDRMYVDEVAELTDEQWGKAMTRHESWEDVEPREWTMLLAGGERVLVREVKEYSTPVLDELAATQEELEELHAYANQQLTDDRVKRLWAQALEHWKFWKRVYLEDVDGEHANVLSWRTWRERAQAAEAKLR